MEKSRVMEIKVRIDCNGCVQKIKKALHGIKGINDIYIDIAQQKLTIIGWADPEKVVKAIKKTRKLAIILSETQPFEPPKEPEPALPRQEPQSTHSTRRPQISRPKEAEEVHVVQHYQSDHNLKHSHERTSTVEHYSSSPSPVYNHEPPQSVHVKHNYHTYKPTPCVTDYKYIGSHLQSTHYTGPELTQQFKHHKPKQPLQQTHYTRPEPQQHHTHYNRTEPPPQQTHYTEPPQQTHYTEPLQHYSKTEPPLHYTNTNYNGEYHSSSNGNGNITSIFSDDNPNACTIV